MITRLITDAEGWVTGMVRQSLATPTVAPAVKPGDVVLTAPLPVGVLLELVYVGPDGQPRTPHDLDVATFRLLDRGYTDQHAAEMVGQAMRSADVLPDVPVEAADAIRRKPRRA